MSSLHKLSPHPCINLSQTTKSKSLTQAGNFGSYETSNMQKKSETILLHRPMKDARPSKFQEKKKRKPLSCQLPRVVCTISRSSPS